MIEAVRTIEDLKRRVMWRARMIALQDHAAIALIAGGLLAAAVALYIKLKPLELPWWPLAVTAFAVVAALALARWYKTAATARYAAFKIDQALDLDDRITTAQVITERGGPGSPIEAALVEDAARRIEGANEAKIVPYAASRWHALSLLGVAAIVAALAVPQKALPESAQLAVERANIESAGEQLEQESQEIEKTAPAGTETAQLAREQAELGRALRRAVGSQSEALKKLSALEERIRERHDELANTRADEIVSLAEKRFGQTLAPKPKRSQTQPSTDKETELAQTESTGEAKPASKDDLKSTEPRAEKKKTEDKKADANPAMSGQQTAPEAKEPAEGAERKPSGQNKAQPQSENVGENQKAQPSAKDGEKAASGQSANSARPPEGRQSEGRQSESQQSQQQKTESENNSAAGVAGSIAEQAAKVLPESAVEQAAKAATPMLSEQLLKQAEQLRANQLTPEDIRKLRQAAESLARDLAPIAQSKEFQQAVADLAKHVDAEQLERVARELMSREDIKREIESAARLLMENRQAKEIVAGLTEMARSQSKNDPQKDRAENQNERAANQGQMQPTDSAGEGRPQGEGQGEGRGSRGGQSGQGGSESMGRGRASRGEGEFQPSGQGRVVKQGGTIQRRAGGEYLYLQTKPGAGAARVPYSSAYPQYRREAERSVRRSQVPAHMRSIIRDYFDAINPESNRKQ